MHLVLLSFFLPLRNFSNSSKVTYGTSEHAFGKLGASQVFGIDVQVVSLLICVAVSSQNRMAAICEHVSP